VPAGPDLAGIVEQPLTDVLPDGLFPVQSCGVGLLDFDGAAAAAAGDPQQVSLNVGQLLRPDRGAGRSRSASTSSNIARQYSGGNSSAGPTAGDVGGTFPRAAAAMECLSICFRVGMRQLAGRSVTSRLEHTKNKCRVR
jgi:hypothetical protein